VPASSQTGASKVLEISGSFEGYEMDVVASWLPQFQRLCGREAGAVGRGGRLDGLPGSLARDHGCLEKVRLLNL
jgi:hypothetical protein